MKHQAQQSTQTSAPVSLDDLRVVETIHGTWVYHLARNGSFRALCGNLVMDTSLPMSSWGKGGNPELHERWCSSCEKLSGIRNGVVGT